MLLLCVLIKIAGQKVSMMGLSLPQIHEVPNSSDKNLGVDKLP